MATNLITRVRRATAALAIAAPALIAGATPAGAQVTASVVDNGNGSITVTYGGTSQGASGFDVWLVFRAPELDCPVNGQVVPYAGVVTAESGAPGSPDLPASPATMTVGSDVNGPGGPGTVPLPEGTYRVCLYTVDQARLTNQDPSAFSVVGDLPAVRIGNPTTPGDSPQVPPAYTG